MLVVAIAMRMVLAAGTTTITRSERIHPISVAGMLACGVAMATSVPLTLAVVNGP